MHFGGLIYRERARYIITAQKTLWRKVAELLGHIREKLFFHALESTLAKRDEISQCKQFL